MKETLSVEKWEMHLKDFKASVATTLMPVFQAHKDKKRNIRMGQELKQKPGEDVAVKQEAEEEFWQKAKAAVLAEHQHLEGENPHDRTLSKRKWHKEWEELWKDADKKFPHKNLSATIDLGAAAPKNVPHEEHSSLVDPLPFQMMNTEVLERTDRGVFWVCFPPEILEQSIRKYASVFNEVARSPKWRVYPFSYLDTKYLNQKYDVHFCNDLTKITFVLEKKSDHPSKHSSGPRDGTSADSLTDMLVEQPAWFTRTLPSDQDIQESVVENFLEDVHSGKLQESRPPKRDL